MPDGIQTNIGAISAYAKQLPFYEQEADKFGAKIDAADVTDEAWGLIGLFAKQGYTAEMYQGMEDAGVVTFGRYEAEIDAVGEGK
jgi:hypothetical protein